MTSPQFKIVATVMQIPVSISEYERGDIWWFATLCTAMLAMLMLAWLQAIEDNLHKGA